jgi:hypothetical protein
MGISDREAEPHFSQPVRQIVSMLIVLALVGAGAYVAFPQVAPVFLANPWLNGFIAFVFVIGLRDLLAGFQLMSSVSWIEGFAADRPGHQITRAPRLLAPLAALLRTRGKRMQISATSSRSILDSVATRIDEERDITRYITNLLIFLGLLGTFYGLATTVPAVVDTIRSLAPQGDEEGMAVFQRLMTGLEAQLGGMGVAFSSSLLGLAGSLVVGLLELFASHGQNRFYRELEEWLSSITRLGYASDGDSRRRPDRDERHRPHGRADVGAARTVRGSEAEPRDDGRPGRPAADAVEKLASRMSRGRDGRKCSPGLPTRRRGSPNFSSSRGGSDGGISGTDAESRMRLRSMDVQLLRILEEMSAGRQESIADLRSDLAQLTRAVRQIGKDAPPITARRSG